MKRPAAVLASLLALSAPACAQEFAGMDDVAGLLGGVRAAALAQSQMPQAPVVRAMGGADRLKADAAGAGGPDVASYQVRGIDVSHYQGAIDWSKVKTDGLSFAYVKATEGAEGVDEDFAANWAGVRSAGLARGAYHFYNFCKTGSAQADQFIKTVPADAGSLPPTVDLEQSGDCKTMPAKASFRKNLAVFVAKLAAAYGYQPIVYVNPAIYDQYFKDENDSYKIWIADTKHAAPELSDNASWTMWQYGWHGKVAGIPREVDLDVFNGTPRMLASLNQDSPVLVASLVQR